MAYSKVVLRHSQSNANIFIANGKFQQQKSTKFLFRIEEFSMFHAFNGLNPYVFVSLRFVLFSFFPFLVDAICSQFYVCVCANLMQ